MKLIEVGREFVVQKTRRGYRAISWYPHYIMTEWVKSMERAIADGDLEVEKYYREDRCRMAKSSMLLNASGANF